MGGKPKSNTPADQRLKANNPNAGKPKSKASPAAMPKPAAQKKGKQS